MKALYCLDGIITVVDAARVETHLDEEKFEGAQNKSVDLLTFVNRVILNRVTPLWKTQDGGVSFFLRRKTKHPRSVERH